MDTGRKSVFLHSGYIGEMRRNCLKSLLFLCVVPEFVRGCDVVLCRNGLPKGPRFFCCSACIFGSSCLLTGLTHLKELPWLALNSEFPSSFFFF